MIVYGLKSTSLTISVVLTDYFKKFLVGLNFESVYFKGGLVLRDLSDILLLF